MKEELFLEKIKKEFPEVKWDKYQVLTHGWDHVVFIFDESLIFRFPKEEEYRSTLNKEIELLNYLKEKVKVGIPDYKYISGDKSFVGYEILKGNKLKNLNFNEITDLDKKEITEQVAKFLNVLHSTPESIVIDELSVSKKNPGKELAEMRGDTRKFIFPKLKEDEIKSIEKYFDEINDFIVKGDYVHVLIHNDFVGEHIFWDDAEKKVNIIDFSDRDFGDPAVDFGGLWEFGEDFVEKVYELYSGEKDNNFLYRSKLYFQRLPIYVMSDSFKGYPCTFEDGYNIFKNRF